MAIRYIGLPSPRQCARRVPQFRPFHARALVEVSVGAGARRRSHASNYFRELRPVAIPSVDLIKASSAVVSFEDQGD